MTDEQANELGFAAAHDTPIPYLQRIRTYYEALGYGAPYEWAHYSWVPFRPLDKPLSECRVTLITTAAPYQPDKGDQGPGAPYNAAAKFYTVYSGDTAADHDLRISHIAIDRKHTTAEDPGTYFPLPALRQCGRRRPHRLGRAALPWPAHQSQPSRDAGGRLPGDRGALQGRRRRCGDAGAQLPGLPPERQPRGAHAGGERHRHRGDGLRQGHRRACRRAAPVVLRLSRSATPPAARTIPSRKPSRSSLRCACSKRAPAPRTTVQSPLVWSEQPGLEARLQQHRAPVARGDRAAARRIRQAEGAWPSRCATRPTQHPARPRDQFVVGFSSSFCTRQLEVSAA